MLLETRYKELAKLAGRHLNEPHKHLSLSWENLKSRLQHLAYRMTIDGKGFAMSSRAVHRQIGRPAVQDGKHLGILEEGHQEIRFQHQSLHSFFALPSLINALHRRWYDNWRPQRLPTIIRSIGDLKEYASPAIPILKDILNDSDTNLRLTTVEALGRIGDSAVQTLVYALNDPESDIRMSATVALGRIGPPSVSAIPNLEQALRYDYWRIRPTAAAALGAIGEPCIPILVSVLKHPDPNTRQSFVEALRQIGSLAHSAVPQLITLLSDRDWDVRWKTIWTLEQINTIEAQKAIELFRKDTSDSVP